MYFKYDLKQDTFYNILKFIVPIIITIISCLTIYKETQEANSIGLIDRNIEFIDMYIYLFKGEKPFNPNELESFKFPFNWFMLNIGLMLIIGDYPFCELYNNHGMTILIKGGSRIKWILSKIVLIFINCIMYFLVIILTLFLFCNMNNIPIIFVLKPSNSDILVSCTTSITGFNLLKLLIMPFLTFTALSYFQLLISFLINNIYGFVAILILESVSVFFDKTIFIGNCSMLIRNSIFKYSNIDTNQSMVILSIVIVVSIATNIIYFKNCDILPLQEE